MEWLEELDLQEYEPKLVQKGVKKVTHMAYVTEKHLQEVGIDGVSLSGSFQGKESSLFVSREPRPKQRDSS